MFLSANKSLIEAPAGHGKTHTIVDCLEQYQYEGKKILILTHTHAGIAAIKEKITERDITCNKFEINTICSFALNLTLSYIPERFLPDDSDMEKRFNKALDLSSKILKALPVQAVISARYEHVIVDEYQDCNLAQHRMIENLAEAVKVHILGDDMQGIFNFNGDSVDLKSKSFEEYQKNKQTLNTPWRWINSGNSKLGDDILKIRIALQNNLPIDLTLYPSIEYVEAIKGDFFSDRKSKIKNTIQQLLWRLYKENVLIIDPQSFKKDYRIKILKRVRNLGMVESIDEKEYYDTVHKLESNSGDELIKSIVDFIKASCAASQLGDWFHDDGTIKNRTAPQYLEKKSSLEQVVEKLKNHHETQNIIDLITFIHQELDCRIVRTEFYYTVLGVLRQAEDRQISYLDSLRINRDKVRRVGRQLKGKHIGTTLLTKGLECHTVLVLDANKFDSPKHFYVAISRACNRLIIASSSPILKPYPKESEPKQKKPKPLSLFDDRDLE